MKYGFISAGGGTWYTNTLSTLSTLAPGNRIWVNVPGRGYVGVGEVFVQNMIGLQMMSSPEG